MSRRRFALETKPQQLPPSAILNSPAPYSLPLRQITEMLVKHFDLHDGLFDLAVEIQIGLGSFGPNPTSALPGAFFGVKSLGLMPASNKGLAVVDASVINPIKKSLKKN